MVNRSGSGSPASPARRRGPRSPDVLLAIAIGGALGASARYGLARALPTTPGHFPWATFWTNTVGSFAIGALLVVVLERMRPTRYVRPFLATGVLGGFTTWSTYQVETALLLKDGHVALGSTYAITSLAAGLAACFVAVRLTRALPLAGPRRRRPPPPPRSLPEVPS